MTTKETNELLSKAENYLNLAEISLQKGYYSETCFLSSLASELAIKGLSLALANSYPTTHDLRQILAYVEEKGYDEVREFVRKNRQKLSKLTSEYFISRDNLGIQYEKEDAEECLNIAKEVFQFVRGLLSGKK